MCQIGTQGPDICPQPQLRSGNFQKSLFKHLSYMFYNLPFKIHKIEDALLYKIATLTTPKSYILPFIYFIQSGFI